MSFVAVVGIVLAVVVEASVEIGVVVKVVWVDDEVPANRTHHGQTCGRQPARKG